MPPQHIQNFGSFTDLIESALSFDRVYIIGLSGFSGAGKTTLCRRASGLFSNLVHHLDCDRFSVFSHVERQSRLDRAATSGDHDVMSAEENPRNWYAWDALYSTLCSLRDRRTFSYDRAWNKKTGMLDENYAISLPMHGPALVLCDCIYLLHSPVRQWFDATIHVDAPFALTLERGQVRSRDTDKAAYMERLHRTYSLPYFEEHSSSADWVYREGWQNS